MLARSMASLYLTQTISAPGSKRKRDVSKEDAPNVRRADGVEPGRTMKRWRNGRPSDEAVHEYTLQKLFAAQSSRLPAGSIPHKPQQQHDSMFPASKPPSTGNMPGFVKLMDSRSAAAAPTIAAEITVCEDCDGRMELSPLEGDEQGRCWNCSRQVCDNGCSIALGDGGRVCLECAVKM